MWIYIYNDEWVKTDESVSGPSQAIGKSGKREEKGHILDTVSRNYEFLHGQMEIANLSNVYNINK